MTLLFHSVMLIADRLVNSDQNTCHKNANGAELETEESLTPAPPDTI